MLRKVLALVLVLTLSLTVCAFAEYPIVSEPITVTGVVVNDKGVGDPRLLWTTMEEVTGIHVNWVAVETESLPVFMAAGDWPDFFHYNFNSSYLNDYAILGNMFVNYKDYLEYMPNLVKTFEDFPMAEKAVTMTNGAIYQLPAIEVSATVTNARFYYRQDVLRNAGLEVPTSTEELYDVLVALKEYNNGAAPLVTDIYSGGYFEPFMYASFGTSNEMDFEDDGTGKVIYNRTSEQYKHYLEYMHRLYSEGLLHQEYLTMDGTTMLSLVSEGLGVFTGGTAQSLSEADFPTGVVEIGVVAPLTSEYDDTRTVRGTAVSQSGGFAINASSKYIVELCKMFDVLFATEEVVPGSGLYGEAGCYGPENGMWRFTDETQDYYEFVLPEGFEGSTTTYQYDHVIYTNCGRQTALAHAVTSTPGNAQCRQLGFVANLIPYQVDPFPSGYLKFTDDEQFVLDNNYLEIDTKINEMRSQFITGVADIENDWDKYVAQINSMGIDEVLKVYQSAYDRWNGVA